MIWSFLRPLVHPANIYVDRDGYGYGDGAYNDMLGHYGRGQGDGGPGNGRSHDTGEGFCYGTGCGYDDDND